MNHRLIFILIFTFLISSVCFAQDEFFHPELNWQTIETEHFLVHFHDGAERTAREAAKAAESIFGPVTSLYDHEPDQRVSIIIRDHDDYSNGGAYFYDNKIEIWAPSLDFELRGTHPWLLNVVTHEFTHIIQIQKSMKFGRKFPGIYLQWLGYEDEQRPDVLYGYPNVIASYPFSGFVIPMWFAEGTAQYNNPSLDYDYWDSHRDMILRMNMLEGTPLEWEEMGMFGKNSLGNESVYNSGFSLVEYISQKYGADKLKEISQKISAPLRLTIDGAIEESLGMTGEQLYNEWKLEKINQYKRMKDSLGTAIREGTIIENEGFGNFYPAFSPDGSKIAYVSNKGMDYLSLSGIYIYDLNTKESRMIKSGVRSSLSFSPDGRYLYYSRIDFDNPHWSGYGDIYKYDLSADDEQRLTYGLRASNPKISPDGRKLVFVYGKDGTANIGICDNDGSNIKNITGFQNGEQVYTPVWSADGKKTAFGYSTAHNQSVAFINSDGSGLAVSNHSGDCRNPFFASDSILYYSWNKGGIYNIYSLNLVTGVERQETNVLGGAFLPSVDKKGNLIFACYKSSGYKIALLQKESDKENLMHGTFTNNAPSFLAPQYPDSSARDEISFKKMPADSVPHSVRPYKPVFTNVLFMPFIRFDDYTQSKNILDIIKPGIYFTSSEVLNKMDIFGGAAINRNWERDIFLITEYRGQLPFLYQLGLEPVVSLELYSISRKRDISFDLYVNNPNHPYGLQTFYTDVSYSLFEFDISLKQKFVSELCEAKIVYALSRYNQDFGSWKHPLFREPIPATRSTYFIGNSFALQLKYDRIMRTVDREINPVGRLVTLKYFYDINKYNPRDSAEYKDGFRVPVYNKFNMNRLELNWTEHIQLPLDKQTLTLGVYAAGILGDSVDQFFDYYAGGFVGMRGYPFYAIGGNKSVSINATYRFPIFTELNFRILQLYFKKLYGSVFYDVGDAWTSDMPSFDKWKRDIGFELRLEAFSFYTMPTRIFFSGAYGLDKFSRSVRDINVTTVQYGREWRFYLGILFGFDLNAMAPRQFMR
ncbi:MAG: PD40 domain-containing protein [Bacteroidetes bacterium]|nr:PD40 domain-containing protein [Bacteroidota bacterium]